MTTITEVVEFVSSEGRSAVRMYFEPLLNLIERIRRIFSLGAKLNAESVRARRLQTELELQAELSDARKRQFQLQVELGATREQVFKLLQENIALRDNLATLQTVKNQLEEEIAHLQQVTTELRSIEADAAKAKEIIREKDEEIERLHGDFNRLRLEAQEKIDKLLDRIKELKNRDESGRRHGGAA